MLRPHVMEHFQKQPGVQQFIGDLTKQFNTTEHQMAECIAGILRNKSLPGLTVMTRARCWIYRPEANSPRAAKPADKRVFEEIGQAREGIVIQDEAGKLYLAKEL